MKTNVKIVSLVVLAVLCFGILAMAQTDTARVVGSVADKSGAAIPGATVIVTNTGTARAVTVKSDATGYFTVSALTAGNYHIDVKMANFKTAGADFTLEVSQVREIPFTLVPGGTSEVVNVTDEVPLVETSTSSTGDVIQGRQVTELPLNGRNFTQLALLTPGVTRGGYGDVAMGGNSGTGSEGFRNSDTGGSSLSVNGLRPEANNFILDGLDNNESLVNTIVFFPPAEAIQEFRVNTSVAPAEFGRAGGAIVQAQIKSGSNQIHGSVFWLRQSGALNARAFGNSSDVYKRNQFGATIGGPIWKNKLFAFIDYQGLRQKQPQGAYSTFVPTNKMRNGDFTDLLGPGGAGMATVPVAQICPNLVGTPLATPHGYVFNPQTCLPFGWVGDAATGAAGPNINIIPTANQNAAGMAYVNAFPLANITGAAINQQNFQVGRQQFRTFDDYDARLDWVASQKDTVFARASMGSDIFSVSDCLKDATHDLPSCFGSGYNFNHPRGIAAGWTRTLTPNLINEFRFGYLRPMYGYQNPQNSINLSAKLGIQAPTDPLLGGIALIGGWGGGGGPQLEYSGDYGLYQVPQKSFQYLDSLTWSHGKHTWKFGVNLINREVDFAQGNRAKGYFWIDDNNCGPGCGGMPWAYPGLGTFTGEQVSELEAGFMGGYQIGNFLGYYKTKNWETGYFAQDDIRVNHRLTLNLGLRYDLYTWPHELNNNMSNFDPATHTLIEAATASNKSLMNTDHTNFGPRIGFAYDMFGDGKTIMRGGFGMFYFLDRGGVGNQLSENPDFNGYSSYFACTGSAGPPDTRTCTGPGTYRITLSGAAAPGSTNPVGATGALPTPANAVANPLALTTANSVIWYPKNSKNSGVQEWNFQIEHALNTNTALEVAYVGTRMNNLTTTFNANANGWFPTVGQITEYAHIGSGTYNGLQTSLKRRMTHGLQYTMAYTWSHTLDNAAGAFSQTGDNTILVNALGVADLSHNKGNSDNDLRHVFVATALYELPWGKGRQYLTNAPKVVDYLLGGWQWNNILTLQSGAPFNVFDSSLLQTHYNGGCQVGVSEFQWLSCPSGAFNVVPSGQGNLARGYFHGPGVHVWDSSIFKTLPITERYKMEFRLEGFNVLNHPVFTNPDGNFGNGDFGKLGPGAAGTRFSSERHVQLVARFLF